MALYQIGRSWRGSCVHYHLTLGIGRPVFSSICDVNPRILTFYLYLSTSLTHVD
jgi:hypothetical protein